MLDLNTPGIVYFGNLWSGENRTSCHHVVRRLSKKFRILYVESPGSRMPRMDSRDLTMIPRKLKAAFDPPREVFPNIHMVTIPQLPKRNYAAVRALNRKLGEALLRKHIRTMGFRRHWCWFTAPDMAEMAGRTGEQLSVYYVTDNYSLFPDVDTADIERLDGQLTRQADLVFVCSPTLLEEKRAINPRAVHSPHGVDAEFFGMASEDSTPLAPDMAGMKRPVIGFFGLIEKWIDLDLVEQLARSRPEWSFVMIGRMATRPGAILNLPNVHFPGPQPYETLPNWTRGFDVAIIPYRHGFQVANASSLKLREYLASGKPIVATATAESQGYRPLVRVADTAEAFLAEIEDALQSETPELRRRRQALVADATWESRVQKVLAVVEDYASEKAPGKTATRT